MTELLIGCGRRRDKLVWNGEYPVYGDWSDLVTMDFNGEVDPSVVVDLLDPLPVRDGSISEIHAYEVLEHLGYQGDWRFFFDQFADFWRVLRPGGLVVGTVPWWQSEWAFGDPSHTRVIHPNNFIFLNQEMYRKNFREGRPMSDFTFYWKLNFDIVALYKLQDQLFFTLRKT
jgi:predicted SAM-dependent methyltransferase